MNKCRLIKINQTDSFFFSADLCDLLRTVSRQVRLAGYCNVSTSVGHDRLTFQNRSIDPLVGDITSAVLAIQNK